MKIHGPNQPNVNPYHQLMQNQKAYKKEAQQKDQLEISSQAKELQESGKISQARKAYVQDIKKQVESGEYKVDSEKTAEKMIAFWSKQS